MRVVEVFENVNFTKEVLFEFLIELGKVDRFDSYVTSSFLKNINC